MSKEQYSSTPYDDVFRTLVNDCSKLVIPLINEAFGEHYSGDEEIRFSPNEHFLNQMSERVLINIAHKYANIQKGVGNIMGGQVLDYEAKRIYKEGHDEGYDKGHDEGYIEALISLVKDGILSSQDAANRAGLSESEFQKKFSSR